MNILKKSKSNPCYNCVYYNACGEDDRTEPCKGQKKLSRKTRKVLNGGK